MDIKNKVIDVFENRIMQLITITDITKLPKWDDVDVLGAECLLKEYRRITSAIHTDGESSAVLEGDVYYVEYIDIDSIILARR